MFHGKGIVKRGWGVGYKGERAEGIFGSGVWIYQLPENDDFTLIPGFLIPLSKVNLTDLCDLVFYAVSNGEPLL